MRKEIEQQYKRALWQMTDGQLNALYDELTDAVYAYGETELGERCASQLQWLDEVITEQVRDEVAAEYRAETNRGA